MTRSLSGSRVAVIGAGQIGLTAAYFLQRRGAEVSLFERHRLGSGAARGNGGLVSSTSATPLNEPGIVRHGLQHLFSPSSAFFVKPSALASMSPWLLGFARRTSKHHFDDALEKLDLLTVDTFPLFDRLHAEGIGTSMSTGMIRCFASPDSARADLKAFRQLGTRAVAQRAGELLNHESLVSLEPAISAAVQSGYLIEGERYLDPSSYVDELFAVLARRGASLREGVEVIGVEERAQTAELHSSTGTERFDRVLIAAGARSGPLVRPFGVKLRMRPGKGYSFVVRLDEELSRVLMFGDAHCAAVPIGGGRVRFAGTMEFDGTYDRMNRKRLEALKAAARQNLRGLDWSTLSDEWVGPRPMTIDGLPFVGPVSPGETVHVATGHNMLGFALGPATGQLVADLMSGVERPREARAFDPSRFSRGKRRERAKFIASLPNR